MREWFGHIAFILVVGLGSASLLTLVERAPVHDPVAEAMLNVDAWAGLSTPTRALPARAIQARERQSALDYSTWATNERREIECLALNIYHEARGESWLGQVAVAEVTLARAVARGGGACREVYRPAQFSWTLCETLRALSPRGSAWERAVEVAQTTRARSLAGVTPLVLPAGTTHYHATYVRPHWANAMQPVAKIGRHVFYTEA